MKKAMWVVGIVAVMLIASFALGATNPKGVCVENCNGRKNPIKQTTLTLPLRTDLLGKDYAEVENKSNITENLTTGDIVGITQYGASKDTSNAAMLTVVTGRSANIVGGDTKLIYEQIPIITTTEVIRYNYTNATYTECHIERYDCNDEQVCLEREVCENITREIISNEYREIVEIPSFAKVIKTDFTNIPVVAVTYIGKILVKIDSTCSWGNWVVPSGNNDGFGKCIDQKTISQILLGLTSKNNYATADIKTIINQVINYFTNNDKQVCMAMENKPAAGKGYIVCSMKGK